MGASQLTAKEIVEAVLSGLALLLSWLVVALVVFWFTRNQLIQLIPALAVRIRKISIGNSSVELAAAEKLASSPEIGPELMRRLVRGLRELGFSSYEVDEAEETSDEELESGNVERDSDVDEIEASDSDRQEFNRTLERLDSDP